MVMNFAIIGVGMYVPERILTNEDIEDMGIGASAEWIYENTGIRERRIADSSQTSSDLGALAAMDAIENADINPDEIDLIVVGTNTPDFLLPQISTIIKQKIQAVNAACFDVQAGCAGFIFGLINAVNYAILNEEIHKILVVGADVFSKATIWTERKLCSIVGDGAGACVLVRTQDTYGLKSSYIYHESMNSINSACLPVLYGEINSGSTIYYKCDGRYLFESGVRHCPKVVRKLLEKAMWEIDEVDLFMFPQTSKKFIFEVAKVLSIPPKKIHTVMDKYGYTFNACIPIAIHDALICKKLGKGDKVILIGMGAGNYCAGVALKWMF